MDAEREVPTVTVRFHIPYRTSYGDSLVVLGNTSVLGSWSQDKAVPLQWVDFCWVTELRVPRSAGQLEYKYAVRHVHGGLTWEHGDNRIVDVASSSVLIDVRDQWRSDTAMREMFYRSCFKDCLFSRATRDTEVAWTVDGSSSVLRVQVYEPRVDPSHSIYIIGSIPELGGSDVKRAVKMSDAKYPLWSASIPLSAATAFPINFKLVLADPTFTQVVYESGGPHTVTASVFSDSESKSVDPVTIVYSAPGFVFAQGQEWHGAGFAIPVFSLRTEQGMGVGEFLDLKKAVDWAAKCDLRLIQILPINDTCVYGTWRDSYPYNSLSVFALHPIYVNIAALGPFSADIQEEHDEAFARLNADSTAPMDYEAVMEAKLSLLRKIFTAQGAATMASAEYLAWFNQHQSWVIPYSAFCFFRDLHGVADPAEWGALQHTTLEKLKELCAPDTFYYQAIAFWSWLQYVLHCQLLEAAEYAKRNHVVLKGDLPIGVARFGVDAWMHPHLFNMNKQTGAPPDAFAADGQNWSFPSYNWGEMAKDNYAWWRQRLTHLAQYFQAYRIDHILGFFRIWEIPAHCVTGLLGQFNPVLPLTRAELESNGIWDFDRLTRPYIRDWTLGSIFGGRADEVKSRFLSWSDGGVWSFKPEFNTEKKLADALPDAGDADLLHKLFSLTANVVLLRDNDVHFHPRIDMEKTSSFWELPEHEKHVLKRLYVSYFFERQEGLWTERAMLKLPMMKSSTPMLVCGEDLGMVPDCVPGVMDALGLLSLRVQRMPKDTKREFGYPHEYPYLSVCTTSSHDTSTLRAWWTEDRGLTQRYYNHVLHKGGAAPAECGSAETKTILQDHLHCPSAWAIFPLQDWLALDDALKARDAESERINVPANPRHYWRWRMHLTVEQLLAEESFDALVKAEVKASNRSLPY